MAAGLEVVVRPVVFPSIRPVARVFVPEDAPDKGIAVISGSGGKLIDLPHSSSVSSSRSRMVEVKRTYDVVRLFYTRPDGTLVDPQKYWDFEVARKMRLRAGQNEIEEEYSDYPEGDNVVKIAAGLTRYSRIYRPGDDD